MMRVPFDSISSGPLIDPPLELASLQLHDRLAANAAERNGAAARVQFQRRHRFDGQLAAAVRGCDAAGDVADRDLPARLGELDRADIADLDLPAARAES